MRKRCNDFNIQVFTLIIYYTAAASSILSDFLDHGFVDVISNSKRVDTNVVLLMFGSFDYNIYIGFLTVCQQENSSLTSILG